MQPEQLLKTLEGKRVHGVHCYCCGNDSAVLRQRYCKDELQLFCDSCETWTSQRITVDDLEEWMRRHSVTGGTVDRRLIIAACLAA